MPVHFTLFQPFLWVKSGTETHIAVLPTASVQWGVRSWFSQPQRGELIQKNKTEQGEQIAGLFTWNLVR